MARHNESNGTKGISRRDFLKKTAMSSMALTPLFAGGSPANGQAFNEFTNRGQAKNIIFMVSDGMSAGTLNMADLITQRQYGYKSNWISIYDSERTFHRGLMDMASLSSPVTDSAAASSSWGCGNRIQNGAVNMGPDGEQYTPVNQIFKNAGKKVGLVTTTRLTHATPAGFSINIDDRNEEDTIAERYLEREYDLMLGGGARHFMAGSRADGTDLLQQFSEKNYQLVRNRSELMRSSNNERLLGLFYDTHLPYTIDRTSNKEYRDAIPSIAEMTKTALTNLQNENGFILQVEGGRVDHGAHDNDAAAMLYDQVEFDEAIKEALNFIDGRDDTLLIITTDHGNGNPALNGAGHRYHETAGHFDQLQNFRHSNSWILDGLNPASSISQIRERVEYATGIGIKKEEASALQQALNDNLNTLYSLKSERTAVLGSIMANYTSINFTGGNHTSDYVELAALGPGIENLDYFVRNTELFGLMLNASGVNANLSLVSS